MVYHGNKLQLCIHILVYECLLPHWFRENSHNGSWLLWGHFIFALHPDTCQFQWLPFECKPVIQSGASCNSSHIHWICIFFMWRCQVWTGDQNKPGWSSYTTIGVWTRNGKASQPHKPWRCVSAKQLPKHLCTWYHKSITRDKFKLLNGLKFINY